MVKRKVSATDVKTTKKAKNAVVNTGQLDCTTPEKAISSLIAPNKLKDFFNTCWEKKPLHIKRKDSEFYGNLFSLENLKEIMEEHEIEFEADVNVCRYVDGEKEILNEEGQITIKKFDKLMKDKKATFQVHQPQRYNKNLWQLMERMETYFGSLVGSNVYITPADAQGLAPHCDDVEIFVLQLEGKKTWKLYTPMVELSKDYTQDLLQESIGKPSFEKTLEPGDLLYFPRGTIHQAKTGSEGHSTHISISTYQQNTFGDFMQHAISQAIENAMEDDVTFRVGLPINYLKFLGTGKNMSKYIEDDSKDKVENEDEDEVKAFKEKVKMLLPKLVDHIDVNTAADSMCADFVNSRLPPFGHEITEDEDEDRKAPTLDDLIKLRYPNHVRVEYIDDDEDEEHSDMSKIDSEDESEEEETAEEEKPVKNGKANEASTKRVDGKRNSKTTGKSETEDDEEDEEANPPEEGPCIRIIHSLNNDRESHMIGMEPSGMVGALKLPLHFAKASIKLLKCTDFVAVKDLDLEEEEDKLILATTLFADDLIEIKS